jgi:hypothetical protein
MVGNAYVASNYLPGNALLRAFFGLLGDPALTGPACAAVSIVLTYDLGRRLWPARPDAAFVGAVLLATSSQLIVTAMTPYAMSAHLALNLLWLWLFIRGRLLTDVAAAFVAFCAMGLHQFIFHPLFAAPFVARLWLTKHWARAGFYTIVYLAFAAFWGEYLTWLLKLHGVAPTGSGLAARGVMGHVVDLVAAFDPAAATGFTAENLVRFAAWQNPLAIGLGLVGAVLAVTKRNAFHVCLASGIVLTILAMVVLLPFQGHGWGYRYLHGLLGNLCLLAAFAWEQLVKPESATARRAWAAMGLTTAFAVLLALPTRAMQASSFIEPYAKAHDAIASLQADVVLVDPKGLWYGQDLVRNDPFPRRGPAVLDLNLLTGRQLLQLCDRYRVAIFDRSAGAALGIRASPAGALSVNRALLTTPSCAAAISAPAPTDLFLKATSSR